MYSDILRRIGGIEVFPVISLLLFVIVFAVVLIWTARLDTDRIEGLERLPLDPPSDGDDDQTRSRA